MFAFSFFLLLPLLPGSAPAQVKFDDGFMRATVVASQSIGVVIIGIPQKNAVGYLKSCKAGVVEIPGHAGMSGPHYGLPHAAFVKGKDVANFSKISGQSIPLKGAYAISGRLTDPAKSKYKLGDLVFGTDGDTMESVVLELCRRRGLTLATAESVTGGLVGARITSISGCSDVFRGSIVSYATEVKLTDAVKSDSGIKASGSMVQLARKVRIVELTLVINVNIDRGKKLANRSKHRE